MKSTELDPDDCPQEAYAFSDKVRKVRWTLDKPPTLGAFFWDGTFPLEMSTDDPGQAKVSYEEDESFFGDAPDWQQSDDTSDLYVDTVVSNDGGQLTFEFSSS